MPGFLNVIVNSFLVFLFGLSLLLGYYFYQNTFVPTTIFEGAVMITPVEVYPGDPIEVEFYVTRNTTCTLEINRLVENEDLREYIIQIETNKFNGDGVRRKSNYVTSIPVTVPPGNYYIFTRTRYYCNLLDHIIPRFITTPRIPITLLPPRKV